MSSYASITYGDGSSKEKNTIRIYLLLFKGLATFKENTAESIHSALKMVKDEKSMTLKSTRSFDHL